MADYWKSQPKKFCEFCKCWISDNKASRDFHENGKRHKESVKSKLDEIRKKGIEDDKNKKEASGFFAEMERAAMLKLREDLATDPSLAAQYGVTIKSKQIGSSPEAVPTSTSSNSNSSISQDVWHESYSPEGYLYYWNPQTNESLWELPPNAVISSEQQFSSYQPETSVSTSQAEANSEYSNTITNSDANSRKEAAGSDSDVKIKKSTIKMMEANVSENTKVSVTNNVKKEDDDIKGSCSSFNSPYGAWTTVPSVQEKTVVDYELPCIEQQQGFTIDVPDEQKQTKKIKFSEKTFSSLTDQEQSTEGFKKRKLNYGSERNIRRCNDEDS